VWPGPIRDLLVGFILILAFIWNSGLNRLRNVECMHRRFFVRGPTVHPDASRNRARLLGSKEARVRKKV